MANLRQWLDQRAATVKLPIGAWARHVRLSGRERRHLERGITGAGLLFAICVGGLDLVTARGLSFELLYVGACVFVGWGAGLWPSLLVAAVSAGLVFWNQTQLGPDVLPVWGRGWNVGIHLCAFVLSGWAADEVRTLRQGLERLVRQRTARLEREIEEHKKTAERQRDTFELLRQVTENITEVFWVADVARTRFNYVSPGFERVWGQPRANLYRDPTTWSNAIHPEDRERLAHAMTTQPGGNYHEQYRVVKPDASIRWVDDRAFPVVNDQGEVYRIVGITEDITARRTAEERLKRSEAQVRATVNTAPIALVAVNHEGIITFEDGKALIAMGVTPGARVGRFALSVYSDFPGLVEQMRRAREGVDSSCIVECGERALDWRLAPVADERRRKTGFIAVATDVTERLLLEREILSISDREQARMGQDIHDGLCQQLIGTALRARSLNESLAAARAPEQASAEKVCGFLDDAITEARRVCRGLYPVRLQSEGLAPALEELAKSTQEREAVECSFEKRLNSLHCDLTTATHLYRIAQEAVNNAIKHSGSNRITISLSVQGAALELSIRDSGKGLVPDSARHSGMGLHIMDYRARSIGGTLSLETLKGGGTTVVCRAPIRAVTVGQTATVETRDG